MWEIYNKTQNANYVHSLKEDTFPSTIQETNSIGFSVITPAYQELTHPSFPNVLLIWKFYQIPVLSNFKK